jgi:hypothetical protein
MVRTAAVAIIAGSHAKVATVISAQHFANVNLAARRRTRVGAAAPKGRPRGGRSPVPRRRACGRHLPCAQRRKKVRLAGRKPWACGGGMILARTAIVGDPRGGDALGERLRNTRRPIAPAGDANRANLPA